MSGGDYSGVSDGQTGVIPGQKSASGKPVSDSMDCCQLRDSSALPDVDGSWRSINFCNLEPGSLQPWLCTGCPSEFSDDPARLCRTFYFLLLFAHLKLPWWAVNHQGFTVVGDGFFGGVAVGKFGCRCCGVDGFCNAKRHSPESLL